MRKRKFGNKKTPCLTKGHKPHDSKLEARVCNRLLAKVQAGEIHSYQSQYRFPLAVEGIIVCHHIVDFLVLYDNDTQEVVEAKGRALDYWKLKMKLFKVIYPRINYRVITKENIHEL